MKPHQDRARAAKVWMPTVVLHRCFRCLVRMPLRDIDGHEARNPGHGVSREGEVLVQPTWQRQHMRQYLSPAPPADAPPAAPGRQPSHIGGACRVCGSTERTAGDGRCWPCQQVRNRRGYLARKERAAATP